MKLKHPLLCRITSYVAVLGAFIAPMVAVICIPVLSDLVKVIVSFLCMAGLLVFLVRNFMNLMALDVFLGTLQGYQGAYRQYPLKTDAKTLEKRLSRFGLDCKPMAVHPVPQMLRYKSTAPVTIYSSGIEKVVAVYRCALLTQEEYRAIVNSAIINSRSLAGKKKPALLDQEQKKSPLNRVTVILILASAVEPTLAGELYEKVCENAGDGFDCSVLPCVVDLSAKTCVFNSPREPYYGMQYPVKNRGIRLIKKYIFGGRLPKGKDALIAEVKDFDPEMTLWQFARELNREQRTDDRKTKKRFSTMSHGDIQVDEDRLLLKWEDRGTVWTIDREADSPELEIQVCDAWDYPKVRPMSKRHAALLQDRVSHHFAKEGCTVRFVTMEEDE